MTVNIKARKLWPIFVAVIMALATAEVVVRIFVTSPSTQVYDEQLGYRYAPNQWQMLAAEGGAYNKTNSLGYLDNEFNPQAAQTIVVLGDSIAESKQVKIAETFHSLIEYEQPNWEVINAGFASFNPSHYPLVLERLQQHLTPTLVVLLLHSGELLGLVNGAADIREDANGNIIDILPQVTAKDKSKQKLEFILSRSALVTLFLRKLKPVVDGLKKDIQSAKQVFNKPAKALAAGPLQQTLEEKIAAHGQDRLAFMLTKLQRISQAPVVVIHFDDLIYREQGLTLLASHLGEGAIFSAAALQVGIPFYDLTQALAESYQLTGQPPVGFANLILGDGHLNQYGHQAIAKALLPILAKNLQPSSAQ